MRGKYRRTTTERGRERRIKKKGHGLHSRKGALKRQEKGKDGEKEREGEPTEKIKVQRPRPSIPSVSQGGWREASLFRNLRQSASQNLSEKNVAVLTAPSFLERFCEADWCNSETN